MTGMRRISVAIPEEMDKRLLEMRKDERFIRCSYSEIVRRMMDQGMKMERSVKTASGGAQ